MSTRTDTSPADQKGWPSGSSSHHRVPSWWVRKNFPRLSLFSRRADRPPHAENAAGHLCDDAAASCASSRTASSSRLLVLPGQLRDVLCPSSSISTPPG